MKKYIAILLMMGCFGCIFASEYHQPKAKEIRYDTVEESRLFHTLDSLVEAGWMWVDVTFNEKTGLCIIKSERNSPKAANLEFTEWDMPVLRECDFEYDKEKAVRENWPNLSKYGYTDGIHKFPARGGGDTYYWIKDGYVVKVVHCGMEIEDCHDINIYWC